MVSRLVFGLASVWETFYEISHRHASLSFSSACPPSFWRRRHTSHRATFEMPVVPLISISAVRVSWVRPCWSGCLNTQIVSRTSLPLDITATTQHWRALTPSLSRAVVPYVDPTDGLRRAPLPLGDLLWRQSAADLTTRKSSSGVGPRVHLEKQEMMVWFPVGWWTDPLPKARGTKSHPLVQGTCSNVMLDHITRTEDKVSTEKRGRTPWLQGRSRANMGVLFKKNHCCLEDSCT